MRMTRTVTAMVGRGRDQVAEVGPFPVDVPWWAEAGPVVEYVERTLGLPVVVLRLIGVEGSEAADGARDGHVTYQVEVLEPATGAGAAPDDDHPLRMPWARASGVRELLGWAGEQVKLTGRPVQRKTWNLSGIFSLPTTQGTVWLKAVPGFADAEATAIAALKDVDRGLVPTVVASGPGRLLIADIAGEDCWEASRETAIDVVRRFAAAQARVEAPKDLPDRRPEVLAAMVRELLDGHVGQELDDDERQAARALLPRWEALARCGLPDTVVHGDFHPGNWRRGEGAPAVVLDLADAHLGNPVLDGLRAIGWLPADRRRPVADAWIEAWRKAVPTSRPAEALEIAEPLAHLAYAVRYQEFLDHIEPSEQVYHRGDPVRAIRDALACGAR